MSSEFRESLQRLIPSLRAFAFCLTQDRSKADDLVYTSLIEIWSKHRFRKGTELSVAAFTVVDRQCQRRSQKNPQLPHAFESSRAGGMERLIAIFDSLEPGEREALSLVGVWGFTEDQAARICAIDTHTLGLRVTNAYLRLMHSLKPRSRSACSDPVFQHTRTKEGCHG